MSNKALQMQPRVARVLKSTSFAAASVNGAVNPINS
jgi:hypothetical protein